MKLRNTIFGSKSEAKVFHALKSRWSPKLTLYPQLPLASIIEIGPQELSPKERDYFYKANIDYTFCQPNGRPILSIEFDGIGGGFSRGGTYIPKRETDDPYRKLKMDLKLKLANAVSYPLVVVSYEERESLDEEESLTILDGIIGQFLAHREFRRRINEMVEDSAREIDQLRAWERHEYIQDLVIQAEVEAELKMDPVTIKAAEYERFAFEQGVNSWSHRYLNDPPLPDIKGLHDVEGLRARAEAMKHTIRVGCQVVISEPIPVIQAVWVRNFEGYGVSPLIVAQNVARYLAFKRAYFLSIGEQ